MRCHYLVLLVVVATLFASANAVEAPESMLLIAKQNDTPVKRALRTSANDDDERAFSASVTEGLSKLVSKAAPKLLLTDDQLQQLAFKVTSTDDVFKLLKLDDGLDGILRNPNFKAFSNYIHMADTTDPADQVLITTLINKYGDEAVAKFLYDAKQVANTKDTAGLLQAAQFIKWFQEGKTPTQVWNLLQLVNKTYGVDRYHQAWWDYVVTYAHLVGKSKKPLPVV